MDFGGGNGGHNYLYDIIDLTWSFSPSALLLADMNLLWLAVAGAWPGLAASERKYVLILQYVDECLFYSRMIVYLLLLLFSWPEMAGAERAETSLLSARTWVILIDVGNNFFQHIKLLKETNKTFTWTSCTAACWRRLGPGELFGADTEHSCSSTASTYVFNSC